MGKVAKAVAVIGIAVAIAVAAPALGAAFLGAIGVSAVAGSAALLAATAVATLALTAAASFIMSAIAGRPSTGAASPIMFRQSITNARIIYGKRRASGVLVFFHPAKINGNHYRYFVIAVTGHRCRGVVRWFLNDEAVTVNSAGLVTSGVYKGRAWLWFGRGTDASETPNVFLTETGGKWTSAHVGKGVAKIFAQFQMTDEVVQAGMPNISAEIEGRDEVRDPRTGIVGYSRNAAAVFYDWLAMAREDGGFGAYADELPDDDWLSAQANVCDEAILLRGGGTEERYAFDSVIEVGAPPSDIRSTFVTCCAGTYAYSGGKHLMRPGHWVPVSVELQEDDLAAAISIPLLGEEGEIATEVSGTFIDPAAMYQPQPVPTRSIVVADVRQGDFDLPHITSHSRGQRILEIMLRRAQAEKRVTWPMNIMGLEVAAMDTVRLGTARYGLSNYAWTVRNWGMSSDYGVVLGVREENEDIYAWTADMELLPGELPQLDRAEPIGDPRAARQIISSTQTVAYPVISDDDSISISAFEAVIDTGARLSFPAATITGLTAATAYVVLWSPTTSTYIVQSQGGVAADAALADATNVLIGSSTTAGADGTYPGSETPPGGWGGGGYGGGGGYQNQVAQQ